MTTRASTATHVADDNGNLGDMVRKTKRHEDHPERGVLGGAAKRQPLGTITSASSQACCVPMMSCVHHMCYRRLQMLRQSREVCV